MKGEDFPKPSFADDELSSIILKACEYHPADRYATAEEMREDLLEYSRKVRLTNATALPMYVESIGTSMSRIDSGSILSMPKSSHGAQVSPPTPNSTQSIFDMEVAKSKGSESLINYEATQSLYNDYVKNNNDEQSFNVKKTNDEAAPVPSSPVYGEPLKGVNNSNENKEDSNDSSITIVPLSEKADVEDTKSVEEQRNTEPIDSIMIPSVSDSSSPIPILSGKEERLLTKITLGLLVFIALVVILTIFFNR